MLHFKTKVQITLVNFGGVPKPIVAIESQLEYTIGVDDILSPPK